MDNNFIVQDWINYIINQGILLNASDIHIEEFENYVQVRYRIDGILSKKMIFNLNKNEIASIIVKIKILGDMDISEKRKPQDGRINNYNFKNENYDLRLSSICTIYGEKIVMRIIPKNLKISSFKDLGFNDNNDENIRKMLKNKSGIIYLSGATGSGKTTTLYSMIDYINDDSLNIYTIENPVEKTIKNINQIQINSLAGIDYSSTLKALLRQDPDVIVVGEIRDSETAKLSIRAALTGHLVITTIHSNNAIDSIGRLIDMNIESYLLSATSIGFISQKLVRTLCPYCKRKISKLKPYESLWLQKIIKENNIDIQQTITLYEPVGCEKCFNGYKGRIAISEILECNENLQKIICNTNDLNSIKQIALQNNFKSLEIDAINKIFKGITSIEEVIKQLN